MEEDAPLLNDEDTRRGFFAWFEGLTYIKGTSLPYNTIFEPVWQE